MRSVTWGVFIFVNDIFDLAFVLFPTNKTGIRGIVLFCRIILP